VGPKTLSVAEENLLTLSPAYLKFYFLISPQNYNEIHKNKYAVLFIFRSTIQTTFGGSIKISKHHLPIYSGSQFFEKHDF